MTDQVVFLNGTNTIISNGNSTYRLNLPSTFKAQNKELALLNAFIYYSWRNVTSAFNNNSFSYTFNNTVYPINMPDGYYDTLYINAYMQLQMFQNGHYLINNTNASNPITVYFINIVENNAYYTNTLTCTPIPSTLPANWTNPANLTLTGATMTLNFSNNNTASLLGFVNSTSYPSTPQSSIYNINAPNTPEINPIYCINMNCNLTSNGSMFNSALNSIYQFNPSNVAYGEQIQLEPVRLFYNKIDNSTYNYIEIYFTDQNNRPSQILDTDISITLIIRDRQN